MSGLVGYGSSDEEEEEDDDAPANSVSQSQNTNATDAEALADVHEAEQNGAHINNDSLTAPMQGPTAGPNRPSHGEYELDGYEDNHDTPTTFISEQDMLRQLTQPSHPVSSFPPDSEGQAETQVTEKFKNFLNLKKTGIHFNENLTDKSSFKNPNLFASLLERIGIPPEAQYSSSLPSAVFSLDNFPPWAYREELLRSQQELDAQLDANKKAQSLAGKRTIQFSTASDTTSTHGGAISETQPKRKKM